jgi:hypothetical protein
MRAAFTLLALFASAASGQTPAEPVLERLLRSTNATTVQDLQEMATMIRSVGDIRYLTVDDAQKALTMRATAAQIARAEWVFQEVDKPANPQSVHEYRAPDGSDDVTRVFFLANTAEPFDLQELVTAVRSIGDIQRLFVCKKPRAVVIRSTAARVARAAWLIPELDQPAGGARPASGPREFRAPFNTELGGPRELRVPGLDDDVTRVFFLTNPSTPEQIQEVVTMVRSIAAIQRAFVCNSPKALPMRAIAWRMAVADWLIGELDRPIGPQDTAVHQLQVPNGQDDVVRVFYQTRAGSPRDLMDTATLLRTQAGLQRIFTYNATKAVAARGTAAQIEMAGKLIEEREKAAR